MGKWIHRLSSKDIILRKAICSICGEVKLKNKGNNQWVCYKAFYASRRGQKNVDWNKPKICIICGSNKSLVLDHDHATGNFRGWICLSCNSLLGFARDNPLTLQAAIKYLQG